MGTGRSGNWWYLPGQNRNRENCLEKVGDGELSSFDMTWPDRGTDGES